MKEKNEDQYRLKVFHLSQRELTVLLYRGRKLPQYAEVCYIPNIPDGASIHSIHLSPERMGFSVLIHHPDFDIVPENQLVPHVDKGLELESRAFKLIAEGVAVDLTMFSDAELDALYDYINLERANREKWRSGKSDNQEETEDPIRV